MGVRVGCLHDVEGDDEHVGAIIHYAQFVPHDDWGRNELWPLQRVVFFWQQSTKRTRTPRMIILLCASLTPSFQGILLGAADGDEVAVGLAMEVAVGLA